MNLDDELRELFADKDKFDVPVSPDAADAVVEGARRRRRRRRAVAGAAGALTMVAVVGAGVAIAVGGGPADAPPADRPLTIGTTTTAPSTVTSTSSSTTKPSSAGRKQTSNRTVPRGHPNPTTTRPTDTGEPPPGNPMVFGPNGFDGLTLGMTAEQAEATGVLTKNGQPDGGPGCTGYDFTNFPRPAGSYAVAVSATGGVVFIVALANAVTPEGIYAGVSGETLRNTYDNGGGDETLYHAPVPGNPGATYEFQLDDRDRVAGMRLILDGADCMQ